MLSLRRGRYAARTAATAGDVDAVLTLRARAFRRTDDPEADRDHLDARCRHVMVEDCGSGRLAAAFRLLPLAHGRDIGLSYAAQHYDLSGLSGYDGRLAEMGRFCIADDIHDPDILRVAWGAMAAYVDSAGVDLLFGCSSFAGTEPQAYLDAFAMLRDRHLAPRRWLPRVKAPRVFRFARALTGIKADRFRAARLMPPLLRTYLLMGGWVSDHAVVDHDLGTLHVFTGLEIRKVPAARSRALRAIAG